MRLWLLDADVVIKFLEIDVFDKLTGLHELHVASSVSDEVKYYRRNGKKSPLTLTQIGDDPNRGRVHIRHC